MNCYMGVDIGTSGCKAVVFDENGNQLTRSYREYDIITPKPGWAELDSNDVMDKCFEVIAETAEHIKPEVTLGLGISSQGEAFTPIDRNGNPLCNALGASDFRGIEYCDKWAINFGLDKLYRITGHNAVATFSLFKLLWLRDNKPDIFNKAYKFLCFEDLLEMKLGIDPAIGWPLAGRTMLFGVVNHRWDKDILKSVGITESQLARPLQSGTVAGTIDKQIAKNLGLTEQTYVVTGGHDQPCSGLGAGALEPGVAVYSTGTVECITPAFKEPVFSNQLQKNNLCTYDHVVPEFYATVAYSLTGGNILKWFRDEFGSEEINKAKKLNCDPYDLIMNQVDPKPTNLLTLPYFTPSGTPYFDSTISGAILGLRLSTKRGQFIRALLEGVAMEMRLNLEILEESGYTITELRSIGGGAKSDFWNQLKADVIGKKITTVNIEEAGCRGVAMLAMAAKTKQSLKDIADNWVKPVSQISPDPEFLKFYNNKMIAYRKLYPAIKSFYTNSVYNA